MSGKVVVPLLELQQQLVAMKQEQQLQQQLLLQSYRHQQRQLAQQHEIQLQERVRVSLNWVIIIIIISLLRNQLAHQSVITDTSISEGCLCLSTPFHNDGIG